MQTFRLPLLQQQFIPRDATAPYDCTATSAGMLADADSRGADVYNHAQVRAATDEARPDPASPGLNWTQVDAAVLALSSGRVNLDVHAFGSAWSVAQAGIAAGRWAGLSIWRGVLVDAGYAGGSGFREGHAVVAGYDPAAGSPVLGDPLVPRWQPISYRLLQEACAEFIVRAGGGAGATGAYFALTRDVYDAPPASLRYTAHFEAGAFWAYSVVGGKIVGRVARQFSKATSAACSAPAVYPWAGQVSRKLVRMTAGALAGLYVEPGSTHVTLTVAKA